MPTRRATRPIAFMEKQTGRLRSAEEDPACQIEAGRGDRPAVSDVLTTNLPEADPSGAFARPVASGFQGPKLCGWISRRVPGPGL